MSAKAARPSIFKGINKSIFLVVGLLLAVLAVIVVIGLSTRAAGARQIESISVFRHDDESTQNIDYVEVSLEYFKKRARNFSTSCDAQTFIDNADSIIPSAEIENVDKNKAVISGDIQSFCFRVGFGDKYVYTSVPIYGVSGGMPIYIKPLFEFPASASEGGKPGGNMTLLLVHVEDYGDVEREYTDIEYVALKRRGLPCNESAFKAADKIFSGENGDLLEGDLVDLELFGLGQYTVESLKESKTQPPKPKYPAVALCFRTRTDVEYHYEKYGDESSGLKLQGGWVFAFNEESSRKDKLILTDDLNVYAIGAFKIDWVALPQGGVCSEQSFAESAGSIGTFLPSLQPIDDFSFVKGAIKASFLDSHYGLCFRADYDGGIYEYKQYDRFWTLVQTEIVYKFTLETYQVDHLLNVQSGRQIGSYRAIRSDFWGSYDKPCGELTFETSPSPSRIVYSQVPVLPAVKSAYAIDSFSRGFNLYLDASDAGRLYCIEVTDTKNNKGYILSQIIYRPSVYEVSVVQDGSGLAAWSHGGNPDAESIDWYVIFTEIPLVDVSDWSNLTDKKKDALNPNDCADITRIHAGGNPYFSVGECVDEKIVIDTCGEEGIWKEAIHKSGASGPEWAIFINSFDDVSLDETALLVCVTPYKFTTRGTEVASTTGLILPRLPANWDDLSMAEKIALNPYDCFAGTMRADNGQCRTAVSAGPEGVSGGPEDIRGSGGPEDIQGSGGPEDIQGSGGS